MHPASFLLALALAVFPFLTSASSHPYSDDIICHGTHCYPRIFQPSTEFQLVHDDQGIPPGLHVRLDISTGRKEAKLYDPTADSDPALEAVQVVPGEGPVDVSVESSAKSLLMIPGAQQPLAQAQANVPPRDPQEAFEEATQAYGAIDPPADLAVEGPLFTAATAALTESPPPNDLPTHLATLADLVSDMHWGAELARSSRAVQSLAALLRSADEAHVTLAAAVLAGAVRNNAPALAAVRAYNFSRPASGAWAGTVYDTVASALHLASDAPPPLGPQAYARLVRLLSGLLHHPAPPNYTHLRTLAGPAHFAAYDAAVREWDRPRQELARLVVDHFAAEFTEGVPAVSERRRSELECDVLGDWMWAFSDALGIRTSAEVSGAELPGMGAEAEQEVREARAAVGRVLDADPGQGGCSRWREWRATGLKPKYEDEKAEETGRAEENAKAKENAKEKAEKARSEL